MANEYCSSGPYDQQTQQQLLYDGLPWNGAPSTPFQPYSTNAGNPNPSRPLPSQLTGGQQPPGPSPPGSSSSTFTGAYLYNVQQGPGEYFYSSQTPYSHNPPGFGPTNRPPIAGIAPAAGVMQNGQIGYQGQVIPGNSLPPTNQAVIFGLVNGRPFTQEIYPNTNLGGPFSTTANPFGNTRGRPYYQTSTPATFTFSLPMSTGGSTIYPGGSTIYPGGSTIYPGGRTQGPDEGDYLDEFGRPTTQAPGAFIPSGGGGGQMQPVGAIQPFRVPQQGGGMGQGGNGQTQQGGGMGQGGSGQTQQGGGMGQGGNGQTGIGISQGGFTGGPQQEGVGQGGPFQPVGGTQQQFTQFPTTNQPIITGYPTTAPFFGQTGGFQPVGQGSGGTTMGSGYLSGGGGGGGGGTTTNRPFPSSDGFPTSTAGNQPGFQQPGNGGNIQPNSGFPYPLNGGFPTGGGVGPNQGVTQYPGQSFNDPQLVVPTQGPGNAFAPGSPLIPPPGFGEGSSYRNNAQRLFKLSALIGIVGILLFYN